MSTVVGSAAGNDDLFMFVEKVGKSKKHFEVEHSIFVSESKLLIE